MNYGGIDLILKARSFLAYSMRGRSSFISDSYSSNDDLPIFLAGVQPCGVPLLWFFLVGLWIDMVVPEIWQTHKTRPTN